MSFDLDSPVNNLFVSQNTGFPVKQIANEIIPNCVSHSDCNWLLTILLKRYLREIFIDALQN